MLAVLIGLVTLGGVTSQSLMDISLFLIFIVFLRDLATKKISFSDFKWLGIEWAFVGYFAVAVIGLALNGKPPVPWFFYLSKFNWILNLYLLIYAFNRVQFSPTKWLYYFSIAFLLPNVYAAVSFAKHHDFITDRSTQVVVGLVNSATYHAHGNSLIFVFFAALLVLLFEKFNLVQKIIFSTAVLLMGLSVFFTYTRGIWAATFITLMVLFIIKSRKAFFAFLFSTAAFFIIYMNNAPIFKERVLSSFATYSDKLRSQLIEVHLLMFQDHPWFGIGYWDSYRQIADYWPRLGLPPDHFESHAHNQIINVLGTTGLLGTFFFLAMVWFFTKKSWSYVQQCRLNKTQSFALSIAIFLLIVQFFLACLTDVSFEYAKIRGILVVGLAALISFMKRTEQKNA